MELRKLLALGSVSTLALITATSAFAQNVSQVEEIEVTGVRRSLQQSLDIKRRSDSVVEAISAEDIGKLPDHNVADALQRVPGVNISSAAAGEGGFDENDRVSIRGTSPSLTQTTVNGHSVSTGDWFLLDQFQTIGRSVSFELFPAEIVASTIVYKSQQADLPEGGVAGSVDIQTRKPLDFKNNYGVEAYLGGEYGDLAGHTDGQFNGLAYWHNDAKTIGVLVQGFSEERHSRRDGQEILGYFNVSPTSPMALAHPDLANVTMPSLIGSALFQQDRKRDGGDIDIQVRPSQALTLEFNGFYSHMEATNQNDNFLFWGSNLGNSLVPTSYKVANGTLVRAAFPAGSNAFVVDDIYRPGAYSQTEYFDGSFKYDATERLRVTGQFGYTQGIGATKASPTFEGNIPSAGTYQLNGLSAPAIVFSPDTNLASFKGVQAGWGWTDVDKVTDTEKYGMLDGQYQLDMGLFQSVKFGVRYANHKRIGQFPVNGGCLTCGPNGPVPAWNGTTYPANFGQNLGGPVLSNLWVLTPAAIQAWVYGGNVNLGSNRHYWPGEMNLNEDDGAIYAMANIGGQGWSGNIGLRVVQTKLASIVNVSGGPAPLNDSLFGPYTPTKFSYSYIDPLPSMNLKFDLRDDLVAHVSAAETMARPDYSALGGAVNLTDLTLTGNGGNPALKPIKSANFDATIEWYYAPQALISFSAFYMDMSSYVDFGVVPGNYYNQLQKKVTTYQITTPFNTSATQQGFEIGWQQPIWNGFGVLANYTYADGRTVNNSPLVGASKNTYNLVGYYENKYGSARLAYTFRSHYLVGLDRSFAENEDDVGSLDSSLNLYVTENIALNFDVLNITNETLKYYANTKDQPRAFYTNGRQYYFGAHFKF